MFFDSNNFGSNLKINGIKRHQSGLSGSELDSLLKGCEFESHSIPTYNTIRKWC